MTHLHHALVMLAAGVGIPILAALNAQLGARLGAPALAAAILFVVAFACAVAVSALLALRQPPPLARALSEPRHLYLAGILVAFYVLSITWIAPRFGVGNAVFFVLLGQIVSAAAIDHWGLFGARAAPLSPVRLLGLVLMGLGVLLARRV